MTNLEYFKNTMTERELADLICNNVSIEFESRVVKAWRRWCGNTGSNVQKNGIIPNIWFWRRTYNKNTEQWETTGRTKSVSIQQFLSMQYKKEYWDKND